MNMKSSHISALVAISLIVFFTFAPGTLRAELVSVDLGLSTPADPQNVLTATLIWKSGQGGFFYQDTDNTTLTGNVMASLTARFSSTTHQVTGIDGIEFTGGTISFSDMSFLLDEDPPTTYAFTGVSGYMDTLAPPAVVIADDFNISEHVLTLNNGVSTRYQGNANTKVDFAVRPVPIVLNGTGNIAASLHSIAGDQAIYNVVMTVPMDYDILLIDKHFSSTYLNLEGAGTLKAEGQFVRTIPEPATAALLALGCAALIGRRRA